MLTICISIYLIFVLFLDASYCCILKVRVRGHSFYSSSTFQCVFECQRYIIRYYKRFKSYNRIYIFIFYLYLYHSHASLFFDNLNACDLGRISTALCEPRGLYQMSDTPEIEIFILSFLGVHLFFVQYIRIYITLAQRCTPSIPAGHTQVRPCSYESSHHGSKCDKFLLNFCYCILEYIQYLYT